MKTTEISIVDIENRKRMEEGMLAKSGRDIRGNDEEYTALLRLAKMAEVDPTFFTYLEVDAAIQATFVKWRERSKLLGGSTNAT